ncbi:cupin domain-containing protein [Mesorhizobium sp. LHD-90]|uniref:cupin domain-containing protein n=1 Tax=Mesorhizobium sp. LHD-90 TaxID=3071414 RepID=UPI0027E0DF96|nr:cupin domain-containing protein [Mesorhizobium sp. LHD-90]MDQ6437661.1 cupin domain-containing protein [Mesorhizobium sp. LHD-90]
MKTISHAEQSREEWRAGVETQMHISASNGSTQLCMFEQWVDSGMGAPTHSHPVEEVLTVVSGEAEIWIDDEANILFGGQSVVVPPNRRHGFRNTGSKALHIRAVLASAIFEATLDDGNTVRRWLPMPE